MNAVAKYEQHHLSAADIRSHVNLVQEVMKAVMKSDTHYGTIPGTNKPTLYKPGAEVLCATFRIAVSYHIEDLSGVDADGCQFVRYRVTATGTHQTTGLMMGTGVGEASSLEEKYKWRRTTGPKEFAATDMSRRRTKFSWDKYKREEYFQDQVRTEAADLANTILKMAAKRAQVAMTLNVTAASDIFTQDIEDLPEDLRSAGNEGGQHPELRAKWIANAEAATNKDQLTRVWTDGLKEIKPTGDMDLYTAFKATVEARGKALSAEKPATQEAAPTTTAPNAPTTTQEAAPTTTHEPTTEEAAQ